MLCQQCRPSMHTIMASRALIGPDLTCDSRLMYDPDHPSCFQQGCGRMMQTHGQGPAGSGPRAGASASAPPANGPSWGQMLTRPLASGPRPRSPGSKQPMVSAAFTYTTTSTSHTSFTILCNTFVSSPFTPVSPFLQLVNTLLVLDLHAAPLTCLPSNLRVIWLPAKWYM